MMMNCYHNLLSYPNQYLYAYCPKHFIIYLVCDIFFRTDVKHLIECFCEIVCPETSSTKQPWVVQKFPENFKDDEMLKQVSLFAFPSEVPW